MKYAYLAMLECCKDDGMRTKIVNITSLYSSFPLVIRNIKTGKYEIHRHSYYSLINQPFVISIGIGTVRGKSTLLNSIFQSTFAVNDRSYFSKGTVDAQILSHCQYPFALIDVCSNSDFVLL